MIGKKELEEAWLKAKETALHLYESETFKDMQKDLKKEAANKIYQNFGEKYLDPYTDL